MPGPVLSAGYHDILIIMLFLTYVITNKQTFEHGHFEFIVSTIVLKFDFMN